MKGTIRRLLLAAARWTGVLHAFRRLNRRTVAVIMLHGVMDDGAESASWRPLRPRVSPATLRRWLGAIARHHRFVTLREAADMVAGRAPFRPGCVAVTFDDGYRNNLTHALPVLREVGAPMTVYLPTGLVERRETFAFDRLDFALQNLGADLVVLRCGATEQPISTRSREAIREAYARLRSGLKGTLGAHLESGPELAALVAECERRARRTLADRGERDPWTALLTWEDAERLAINGEAEFGGHTVDHVRLALADDATIRDQLRRSRRALRARLGGAFVPSVAYPNGSCDARVAAIAREEGYTSGLTSEEGLNAPGDDPMLLKRIAIPEDAGPTEALAQVCGFAHFLDRWTARVKKALRRRRLARGAMPAPTEPLTAAAA